MSAKYWLDALSASLESIGKLDALTQEELVEVAEGIAISAENEGMAYGRECIPNPKDSEIAELKRGYERRIAELEARDLAFRESVARRRGVEPDQVHIENGRVFYELD